MSKHLSVKEALHCALLEEMRRDDSVFLMTSALSPSGGLGGVADALAQTMPGRTVSVSLCESALGGIAVGAALRGLRPCVELTQSDALASCADAVLRQAAGLRFASGGQCSVPLVLRMSAGAGPQALSLESLVCRFPGVKAAVPSCAEDAKGLLLAALQDPDPVVLLEHPLLYDQVGEVPDTDTPIPLGSACLRREGRDVSIFAWGRQVAFALEAAQQLAEGGIEAEVVDLRTLVPLDWESICRSVCKTHHVLVVSQEVRRCSFAGELTAQIAQELFDELDAPPERLCALNSLPPVSPALTGAYFPHPQDIAAAVRQLVNQ